MGLVGGTLSGGCSSAPDLSTQEAFCQAVAQADCSPAVVSACYLAGPNTIDSDTQRCIRFRSAPEQCNPANLPFHADNAQACVNAHSAAYAAGTLDPTALANMNTTCEAVFNRGGPTGTRCNADTDCDVVNGLSCVLHASGNGSCQVPIPVNPGDSCASPASQCSTGYYCEASGHCVSNPTTGGQCGVGIPCATMSRCVASANGNAGVCEPQLGDMQPCSANGDCLGGFCVSLSSGKVCAGQLPQLAAGTPVCIALVGK
jgi:hypothetical protein